MNDELHAWWAQLRHGGMLIAPALLVEFFPEIHEGHGRAYATLRDAWLKFSAGDDTAEAKRAFVAAVLEDYLGLHGWLKASQVTDAFKARSPTGESLRPDRVLIDERSRGLLAVKVDDSDRVGMGRGRRAHARFVELLRATGVAIGLLTNGRQFRVIHAGRDYDAWAEWDASAWFDEGDARVQLFGLRTLLGHESVNADPGDGIVGAIAASRTRQGELAQVLGEQVRGAVELLIRELDVNLRRDEDLLRRIRKDPSTGTELEEGAVLAALYQAATRFVMRLVVLLFAEARDLLPQSIEHYHRSYGIEGLFQQLSEAARHEGRAALTERRSAWPRLLALFDAVHAGVPHEALPMNSYGGVLFRPGDHDDRDAVLRGLAAFEEIEIDDGAIYEALRLLKIGRVRVRRGKSSTWSAGPVDFSDLRTEYIGTIYEGLLDYELKRAREDAIVFLGIGKQPALPLARLEAMSPPQIKDLFSKLKKDKSGPAVDESEEEAPEDTTEPDEDEAEDSAIQEVEPEPAQVTDEVLARAHAWGERAVEEAGVVRRKKGGDSLGYERRRADAARGLIVRVVSPDELYLVAWGGTRKGSGTFYTRPALAVPTTQRTLEPLCYESTPEGPTPRTPEDILGIKVCDPAMGSGSFLVAALRYLTEALAAALVAHGRIAARGDETAVTLPFGREAAGTEREELLPVRAEDERFERLLRARLARHVVERCIYGVDVNPLAVELARLALWVETMDRELPFEFLDHKLKVGNSLVGCWLHLVNDYPAQAWPREGGDGKKGPHTKWLKKVFADVKAELPDWIQAQTGQINLFGDTGADGVEAVGRLAARYEAIHDLAPHERERAYAELLASEDNRTVKQGMDRWCALWFWPAEREPVLTPSEWASPPTTIDEIVAEVTVAQRFFHWELEFPDVFGAGRKGFDAMVGNPPWETVQPESLEFFSNHDPLYRTYGKQQGLRVMDALFEREPQINEDWVAYQAKFKALNNYVSSSVDPFDVSVGRGREGQLRGAWELRRRRWQSVADPDHPYRHQGSGKVYTYKLFLEAAHHLLRDGGRVGFIVPSAIWTDKGATELRRLFLTHCSWEWCYGFENRHRIFPIDSRYKFAPIVVQRHGITSAVRAAFMRHDVAEWEAPLPPTLTVEFDDVRRFAPQTFSFMEFKDHRDLEPQRGSTPIIRCSAKLSPVQGARTRRNST